MAERRLSTVADAPTQPVNLAFDSAGHLLVVSYAGNGTIYALDERGTLDRLLQGEAARSRPGARVILPVSDWRLQKDDTGAPLPRTRHYVAPDGATYVSATPGFAEGQMSWGVKSSDLVRSFGLQGALPGDRVYLTSEAEVATWSARVGEDGGLSDLRPFADQGGEAVATDALGNVYIAAGDVLVYDPKGQRIDTITLPRRAVQIAFGGPDRRTLFLCARDALYSVRMRVPGPTWPSDASKAPPASLPEAP